jgi:hypothetical protein
MTHAPARCLPAVPNTQLHALLLGRPVTARISSCRPTTPSPPFSPLSRPSPRPLTHDPTKRSSERPTTDLPPSSDKCPLGSSTEVDLRPRVQLAVVSATSNGRDSAGEMRIRPGLERIKAVSSRGKERRRACEEYGTVSLHILDVA